MNVIVLGDAMSAAPDVPQFGYVFRLQVPYGMIGRFAGTVDGSMAPYCPPDELALIKAGYWTETTGVYTATGKTWAQVNTDGPTQTGITTALTNLYTTAQNALNAQKSWVFLGATKSDTGVWKTS